MVLQTIGGACGMGLGVIANEGDYGIECVSGLLATSECLCVSWVLPTRVSGCPILTEFGNVHWCLL